MAHVVVKGGLVPTMLSQDWLTNHANIKYVNG